MVLSFIIDNSLPLILPHSSSLSPFGPSTYLSLSSSQLDSALTDCVVSTCSIATVEFDHTGDYLATGDKGGRVVLFERNETKKGCEYKFYTEFQSHEPEFDYLKSLEIEEKINKIRWCKRQNAAHFLLSTNGASFSTSNCYPSRGCDHLRVKSEHLFSSRLTDHL